MVKSFGFMAAIAVCVSSCGPTDGGVKPLEVTPNYITFYSPEHPRIFEDPTHIMGGIASEHCQKDGRLAVFHSYDSATGTVKYECARYVKGKRVE